MGGAVSRGRDNDELVDNLIESRYIRTKSVEHVFRAVDRADYVLSSHRESAYKDSAWKHGNIHLSAPCVYSEVMEGLSLEPGMSFLNLGSGTGYLSTMAGLILGQSGINHGIELHADCIKYAYDRLEEFKQKSLAIDEFDFCEPAFIQGNCLSLMHGRRYDRVYCGAACPEEYEVFIKQFVDVGGILVMPFKDHLHRMQRVGETLWKTRTMLPVSFATLVVPTTTEQNLLHLPECDPVSLQELCRSKIRHRLREKVWFEHKELEIEKPILQERPKYSSPQRTLRQFVIPIFEESDETLSSGDEEYSGRAGFIIHNHPGEPITTTLQLVRAVIQPNQREGRQNTQESRPVDSDDNQSNSNELVDNQVNSNELVDNQLNRNELCDLELKCKKKLESLNKNSHTYGYHSEIGSDSARERSENQIEESNDRSVERERCVDKDYTIISESESETELEAPIQRAKIAKREKMDSGIEDSNVTNDDNRSSSNQLSSSDSESGDGDAMDLDLSDIIPTRALENSHSNDNIEEKAAVAHYIDSNALHSYMVEKIHQLPLPHSLKLYINYDRKL